MPTVLREGPYLVHIHTHEPNEPPHVHVVRDACEAKFWISPVSYARGRGFRPVELRRIGRILELHAKHLLGRWNGIHGLPTGRPHPGDPDR